VQELEVLVRTAPFQTPPPPSFGCLLQGGRATGLNSDYQPKPGEETQGSRVSPGAVLFCTFRTPAGLINYHHSGQEIRPLPRTDAALGLEGRLYSRIGHSIDLPGRRLDESTLILKGRTTFGAKPAASPFRPPPNSAGGAASGQPPPSSGSNGPPSRACWRRAPIMYVSGRWDRRADGCRKELRGPPEANKPMARLKTRQVYLGCVFTQHKTD